MFSFWHCGKYSETPLGYRGAAEVGCKEPHPSNQPHTIRIAPFNSYLTTHTS
ncbi:hypothetical protein BU16DRAFT_531227 [Lophium mytilinum]|uniref:Uncharacterized protein n=1 Tax=Lophium mytilinum TaxID=390894 RepID=A0A6A6QE39_9PEZI|nr:hypothetical protein BU16DRAFT_531227 [Lophium mytilinum]